MPEPEAQVHEVPDVDVCVIGAGITGIYQLHRALEAGCSAVLLEAGDGVGGTWFWNRYPGARFDSESYTYGYLFSEELFSEWEWQEHFAGQREVERYLNHVVDKFDLRRHMRFGTRVTGAVWDDAAAAWRVTTDDGAGGVTARWLVAATGVFTVPTYPAVPGRETFRGEQHHTGRWPKHEVPFADKRVAVVGTGSSGVQVVPVVAPVAASLAVFQRTANWCTPLNNRPITPDEQAELRADFERIRHVLNTSMHGFLHEAHDRKTFDDSADARQAYYEKMWSSPGFTKLTTNYTDLLLDERANAEWCEFLAAKIRSIVQDPAVAERLIPKDHRFGEHRPPFATDYYETFNRANVTLVDTRENPMVRVVPEGIETADGVVHELDIIVWATGWDFGTGALNRMGVRGRGGVALEDHWADGPTTFAGVQTVGFPNFFFPGGPHAAAGNNPRYNGDQVEFVTDVIGFARAHGCTVVEVDPTAEDEWTAMVDRWAVRPPAFGMRSYYFGANVPGKPRRYLLNSAGRPKLHQIIADQHANDFKAFRFSSR